MKRTLILLSLLLAGCGHIQSGMYKLSPRVKPGPYCAGAGCENMDKRGAVKVSRKQKSAALTRTQQEKGGGS